MAAQMMSALSHILFLFLLINYNCAEETNNALKNNDGALQDNVGDSYLVEQNVELEDGIHGRHKRDLKHIKSLKLRLEWFDKSTDALVGGEYSKDLRDDGTVIEQLGLSIANNVNNGGYDVLPGWVGILQNYFNHRINLGAFDYQVAFDYREWWEDMRVINFELNKSPSWNRHGGNIYVNLTPDVSGEIVRAVYQFYGHKDPSTMVRVHLLGTSIDVKLNENVDREFTPVQKQLVKGQAFEVKHGTHATQTRHSKFEMSKPLWVKLSLTVRVKT